MFSGAFAYAFLLSPHIAMINSTLPSLASSHPYVAYSGCSMPNQGTPALLPQAANAPLTGKQRRLQQRQAERRARKHAAAGRGDPLGRALVTVEKTGVATLWHATTLPEIAWHALKYFLPTQLPGQALTQNIWNMVQIFSQAIQGVPQGDLQGASGQLREGPASSPTGTLTTRHAGTVGVRIWHMLSSIWPVRTGQALTRNAWSTIETFSSAITNLSDDSVSCRKTRLAELRGNAASQRWVSLRTLHALCAELGFTIETNVPKSRWRVQRPLAYAIGAVDDADIVKGKVRDIVSAIRRPGDYVLSKSDETRPAPEKRCFGAPPSYCISIDPPALRDDAQEKGVISRDFLLDVLEFLRELAPDSVPAIERRLPYREVLARYKAALAQVDDGTIPLSDEEMSKLQELSVYADASRTVFKQAVAASRPARHAYFAQSMKDYDLDVNVIGVFEPADLDGIRDALRQRGDIYYAILRAPGRDAGVYPPF